MLLAKILTGGSSILLKAIFSLRTERISPKLRGAFRKVPECLSTTIPPIPRDQCLFDSLHNKSTPNASSVRGYSGLKGYRF